MASRCSDTVSRGRRHVGDERVGRVDAELAAWRCGPAGRGAARRSPCGAGSAGGPRWPRRPGPARPGRGSRRRTRPRTAARSGRRPPRSWSQTASRNHRSWVTTTSAPRRPSRCRASQSMPATSRWLVGSSRIEQVGLADQQRGERDPAPLATGHRPDRRRPGRGGACRGRRGWSGRRRRRPTRARRPMPGRQPGGAEHHVPDGGLGGQVEVCGSAGDPQVAAVGDPAGVGLLRLGRASAAGWTCRRR